MGLNILDLKRFIVLCGIDMWHYIVWVPLTNSKSKEGFLRHERMWKLPASYIRPPKHRTGARNIYEIAHRNSKSSDLDHFDKDSNRMPEA